MLEIIEKELQKLNREKWFEIGEGKVRNLFFKIEYLGSINPNKVIAEIANDWGEKERIKFLKKIIADAKASK